MGATHKINADVEVTGTLSVSSTTAVGGTVLGTSAKFGRDAHNLIDFTTDNSILFRVNNANRLRLDQSQCYPVTSDGVSLGTGTNMFSDLFLASGGVINFNNGDVTITHSSNQLDISGGVIVLDASDHVIKDGGNILDENDNTLISTSGGACNISGSAATLTNARTIGGVSFNGSANINLPGVNTSGNQDTSGNAATATALTSGNKTIAGILDITDATDSSDATGDTGALRTEGGASIAKQLYVGTDLSVGGKVTTTEIEGSSILLDSAADIELNCDGADVILKDATTEFGRFKNDSSDFVIKSAVSNKDMIFKGVDGGSAITALTLDMSEAGKATFNNDVVAFSDRKLKDNIETLDGKKVLDMRGVSFTRKDTGLASSGVIAQEIQEVAPELVNETNGTLGVSYGNLVGYLIEAIKDQQKQIDELKEMCNGCSR